MESGGIPVEAEGLTVLSLRLVVVALPGVDVAQASMSGGQIRLETESLLKAGSRLVKPARSQEDMPQITVSLGSVDLVRQCFLLAGNGFIDLAAQGQDGAEVVESCRVARLKSESSAEGQLSFDELILSQTSRAEQSKGFRVIRVGLDELPVDRFGLR